MLVAAGTVEEMRIYLIRKVIFSLPFGEESCNFSSIFIPQDKLWSRPNIIPMPKTKVSVTLDSELAKEIDNYLRELVKKATD